MRVGLLSDTYFPVINGITNFVHLHQRELEGLGHEPWVFAPGNPADSDLDQRVVRYPAIPLARTGYYIGFGVNRPTREQLRRMDILHAQHPFLSGTIAARIRRRYGIPVVFTNHTRYDLYTQYYLPLLPPALSHTFLTTFFPAFTSQVDAVIAPSPSILALLREWGVKARIEVISNGIDVEAFRRPRLRFTRGQVGLPQEGPVVIFVGRMAAEKNVETLLRAFASVVKEIVPEVTLLLVGGGTHLEAYQALARDLQIAGRVVFTGPVPYEHVPGYLSLADLFATASTSEVHPLTILEAMAAGLPVLGIRSPGLVDTVENGVNGFVVDNDRAALALRLAQLLTDDDLRARLAEGAHRTAARFDIRRTSRQILALYESLL